MMSLVKISLLDVVKKQFTFKLKSYTQVYISLVTLQLLAIIFSFNGVGMMGAGSGTLEVKVNYYSANIVIIFTILWALISSILITTKAYRNDDFAFVTNRLSSNLANILYLMTASIVGAATALLSTSLMTIVLFLIKGNQFENSSSTLTELLTGYTATLLYVLLFSALGYFIGMLIQYNKIFTVIIPACFFGFLFLGIGSTKASNGVQLAAAFFNESSIFLFIVKMLLSITLLFAGACILSNKMEVRE
ncbi:hypothetical protein [Bacillus sp. MRMR6]|uniref:hypothetical protein n=1 Tax=Bacillus sp. MRMR6 TaxID=1928617 RepID=UPI001115347A|nr:hypothetical protein [Bacillus sp. MRMR6]